MIVGRGSDSMTVGFTQSIIITRFCSSLCYCSEHIISGKDVVLKEICVGAVRQHLNSVQSTDRCKTGMY